MIVELTREEFRIVLNAVQQLRDEGWEYDADVTIGRHLCEKLKYIKLAYEETVE